MARPNRDVTFRSILCPIEFSRQSRTALRYAESIVSRADGRLSVLYQGVLERATVPVLAIPRRASRRAWPR